MVPVQPVRDEFFVGVQIVQNHVGVAFVAGCEHDDFTKFRQLPQQFVSMGPDIDSSVYFLTRWELNFQAYIVRGV